VKGDTELAAVMRKLIADGEDRGYVNAGDGWITVDVRQVEITEEELQAVEEAMSGG